MKLSADPNLRSWQHIRQQAADRPLSGVARRKRLVRRAGIGITLVLASALGSLGAWGVKLYRDDPARLRAADPAAPLEAVEFSTDGVLTEAWVREELGIEEGAPLLRYDIFALQTHLLTTRQVSAASVERVLPGTLRIRLTERAPIARIAVDDGAGGFSTQLVARDGAVFEGKLFSDAQLRQLPWLGGAKLRRGEPGGFEPVEGAQAAAELLDAVRESVPGLADDWAVVDLASYDARPEAALSQIKVRTRGQVEYVFRAADFRPQVLRLAAIVADLQGRRMKPRMLDLSFEQQVVVQADPLPAAPPAPANGPGRRGGARRA